MVREVHGLVSAVAAVRNRIRKQIIHHTARQWPLQKPRNIPAFLSVALSVFHRSQNASSGSATRIFLRPRDVWISFKVGAFQFSGSIPHQAVFPGLTIGSRPDAVVCLSGPARKRAQGVEWERMIHWTGVGVRLSEKSSVRAKARDKR
jgi:hypothetical protein